MRVGAPEYGTLVYVSDTSRQTLLEQLGGLSGLVYSTLPVLVFVPINSVWGLTAAIWSAIAVAAVSWCGD